MKKGYTIVDVLVVIVVLATLAAIAVPVYSRIIRRASMREVVTLIALTRVGARYYDGKYGISALATPGNLSTLSVDVPPGTVCTYSIVAGGTTNRQLQVDSSGDWLYTYDLPNGPGTINADNPDARYIQDLP